MPNWNDDGGQYVINLESDNELLRTENEQMKAELAALRPWAALREEWYIDGQSGRWHCCNGSVPMFMADKHSPGCDVPALLAQLEANPDA